MTKRSPQAKLLAKRFLPVVGFSVVTVGLGLWYWDGQGYPVPERLTPHYMADDPFAASPSRTAFETWVSKRVGDFRQWRFDRMFSSRNLKGSRWTYQAASLGDPSRPAESIRVIKKGMIEFQEGQIAKVTPPFIDSLLDAPELFYRKDNNALHLSLDRGALEKGEEASVVIIHATGLEGSGVFLRNWQGMGGLKWMTLERQ